MIIDKLESLPCTHLKGVGTRLADKLAKINIHTIQDLLFHLPSRYQDRTHITPIRDLRVGDYAVIEGVIKKSRMTWGKKPSFICELTDATGHLNLLFFHFYASQQNSLTEGVHLRCFGEVRLGPKGLSMIHPEYKRLALDEEITVEEHLTPIYPVTEGLGQQSIRQLVDQALAFLEKNMPIADYMPPSLLKYYQLPTLKEAILYVHRPPPDANTALLQAGNHPMQKRLVLEELIAHHLSLRRLREHVKHYKAPKLPFIGNLQNKLLSQLPFSLTRAQERVLADIINDLENHHPMMRLVQGDVGSGKTVVAILSMLQAVEHGYQAALMAPTEILAEQHFINFTTWLSSFGITTEWLSGQSKGKRRQAILENIQNGNAKIIVGTHALFQKDVNFHRLALIIIDEQHRFGVHQRMALREKGTDDLLHPHQLIMTATPIPRTLAMTAYADMDYSVIDELPPGRTPINTVALPNTRREEVLTRVREICKMKRQTYWVCTLIEESEALTCQAAEATTVELKMLLPELKIALVHGRMRPAEKEDVMQAFKKGEIDLLVATTVIEVGVDVPNASLMIIENPERLGLAQLHQLRGRIGRGSTASFCVLLYQAPLSELARERIKIIRETTDGFAIAQKDMELRGPGEVLGTRQTGLLQFKIADILRDKELLPTVHEAAVLILQEFPEMVEPLIKRWLGEMEQYAGV